MEKSSNDFFRIKIDNYQFEGRKTRKNCTFVYYSCYFLETSSNDFFRIKVDNHQFDQKLQFPNL